MGGPFGIGEFIASVFYLGAFGVILYVINIISK